MIKSGLGALALAALTACAPQTLPQQAAAPVIDEAAVIAASVPVAQAFQAQLQTQLRAAIAAAPVVDGKPGRQIVQTGSGGAAKVHFLSAIPMQDQPCSVCHGTNVAPDLEAHIDSLYPGDLATGFAPGELRGALLISWDAARFLQ